MIEMRQRETRAAQAADKAKLASREAPPESSLAPGAAPHGAFRRIGGALFAWLALSDAATVLGANRWFVVVCFACCFTHPARAQDLSPRAYVITPVGTNVVVLSDSRFRGSLTFNASVPITGAQADINVPVVSYYHTLDFLGRTASLTLVQPYGVGDFQGTIAEVPRETHRSGLFDLSARFAVNLIGGPAMEPAEFSKWHQSVLFGTSLTVTAPTGQYDPMLLVNLGNNRWSFKWELGYSERWGNWILDGYGSVTYFTTNPEYFSNNMYYPGLRSQYEQPVGQIETHLSYDFQPRLWISLDANFWWGGATDINGIENRLTNQKNSRVGMTASVPLTAHQSIKVSFSDGAYVSYGGNYRSVSLAWQYTWNGWRFR